MKNHHMLLSLFLLFHIFSFTNSHSKPFEFEENGIHYKINSFDSTKPCWQTLWKVPVWIAIKTEDKNIDIDTYNLFKNINVLNGNKITQIINSIACTLASMGGFITTSLILNKFKDFFSTCNLWTLITEKIYKYPTLKTALLKYLPLVPVATGASFYLGWEIVNRFFNERNVTINSHSSSLLFGFVSQNDLEKLENGSLKPELNYQTIK